MMILKPQDILVLLKLSVMHGRQWTYHHLAVELAMSPSEVHAAVNRAISAQLALRIKTEVTVNNKNLKEFIVHGLKYVFLPERGEITRGILTIYSVPPLSTLPFDSDELMPVWPDPSGDTRGMAFSPLYKAAPVASRNDSALYELLVLVDAIRGGRARERNMAIEEIKNRLPS